MTHKQNQLVLTLDNVEAKMILSKTPLRMSFVGGGSDIPAYYRQETGAVLSTSIDKYMYIAVNTKFDGRVRLSYSMTEEVDRADQISHPLVREALRLLGIKGGIEIVSVSDIPSKGTGLGSSSSYTVGLLNALYAYQSRYVSKARLAAEACMIEMEKCGEPIGKQDQYAAAFGGMNLIRFHPDESVDIEPVICAPAILRELEQSILVFFTGRTRSASAVLVQQQTNLQSTGRKLLMRRMVELAHEMKAELESGTLESIGALLDENWRLKTQMAAGVSDSQIDSWYDAGIRNGALGGKLLGAGNGGFIMFFAPPHTHNAIRSALSNLQPVTFKFDRNGTHIVYYQPSE